MQPSNVSIMGDNNLSNFYSLILNRDYIHNEYCQNKKQMIYKEEYIVFESCDFSLDQYYNFISQSYAVIVY